MERREEERRGKAVKGVKVEAARSGGTEVADPFSASGT